MFPRCPPGFLEEIILYMKPKIVLPKDYIFQEGERGCELFIIAKGYCMLSTGGFDLDLLK